MNSGKNCFVLAFLLNALVSGVEVSCVEAEQTYGAYLWLLLLVAGTLNLCTVLALGTAVNLLRKLPIQSGRFTDLTVELCQSALRSGIGNSAKSALLGSALSKPELKKLFK